MSSETKKQKKLSLSGGASQCSGVKLKASCRMAIMDQAFSFFSLLQISGTILSAPPGPSPPTTGYSPHAGGGWLR